MTMTLNIPGLSSGVYILFAKNCGKRVPFYVGESDAIFRRLGDYQVANFTAETDFLVGTAITHLRTFNYEIEAELHFFKGDRKVRRVRESDEIDRMKSLGYKLINRGGTQKGYRYKSAIMQEVANRFRSEISGIVEHNIRL